MKDDGCQAPGGGRRLQRVMRELSGVIAITVAVTRLYPCVELHPTICEFYCMLIISIKLLFKKSFETRKEITACAMAVRIVEALSINEAAPEAAIRKEGPVRRRRWSKRAGGTHP